MRSFVVDPDLPLPRKAAKVSVVPDPCAGLIRTDRAMDRSILLAGRRSVVDARGLEGVRRVTADGLPLSGAIQLHGPAAANVVVTPRSLIRERIGAEGGLRECVLVPERLPGVIVQWTATGRWEGLTLEVSLPESPVATDGRYRADEGVLRWATSIDGTGGVLQLCGIRDGEWRVVETEGGWRAQISIGLGPDGPSTLLLSLIGDEARLPSLAALAAVRAHRRRDELEPDDAPGLSLQTGVPDLDDGVGWARAAIRAGVEDLHGDSRLRWSVGPSMAAAALAAGEREVARTALAHSPPTIADAEARARWMAWTAKPRPLVDARQRLESTLAEAPQDVRARVADAAEAAGEEEWATALRTAITREGGRRLPTIRTRGETPVARTGPLSAPPEAERPTLPFDLDHPPALESVRRAVAILRSDDPDPGLELLRSALSWMRHHVTPAEGAQAGATLRLLVEGLLGIDPDAAYSRLRLSPCLPASWDAFHVLGIQLGDAVVDMEMSRAGLTYRFALRQKAGGAPITWIFAPRLPGRGVAHVRIDGEEALVDSRAIGRRVEPRIQIPAERERIVEVELTPP